MSDAENNNGNGPQRKKKVTKRQGKKKATKKKAAKKAAKKTTKKKGGKQAGGKDQQPDNKAKPADDFPDDISKLTIYQRVSLARRVMPDFKADLNVDGKYDAMSAKEINNKLRPLMAKCGLIDYIALKSTSTGDSGVRWSNGNTIVFHTKAIYKYFCINVDKPEEKISYPCEGIGEDTGDKGPGKAHTYALKSARKALFSITEGGDEEQRIADEEKTAAGKAFLNDEQQDVLLQLADDYFGDDSEKALEHLCKHSTVMAKSLAEIREDQFVMAQNILTNWAKAKGLIADENDDPDKPE